MVWKENVGQFWNVEPRGDPTATPSTWMQNLLLNVTNDFLLTKFSNSRKSFLDIHLTKIFGFWKFLYSNINSSI